MNGGSAGRAARRRGGWIAAIALTVVLGLVRSGRADGPLFCLPPVFEGGQRLHELPSPRVFRVDLLLRQHELCWWALLEPRALRVVVVGASGVFGFPLPIDETFGGLINAQLAAQGRPARLFNLAWVNPYQLRDAVVIHEALAYKPDVIVYPMTLSEFAHLAPVVWPQLVRFFDENRHTITALAADPPPGLAEPLEAYRRTIERRQKLYSRLDWLREMGTLVRTGVQRHAKSVAVRFGAPPEARGAPQSKGQYDCADTLSKLAEGFRNWRDWSILGYLQALQEREGIAVIVINWPLAHDPIGECYNARFSNTAVDEFNDWLAAETRRLGLTYLDLHHALPNASFFDSVHLTADGHRAVAAQLTTTLVPLLERIAAERGLDGAPGTGRDAGARPARPPGAG